MSFDWFDPQETIKKLQAENTKLRALLEEVEYDNYGFCFWCDCFNGHYSDCKRQSALGLTK